MEEFRMEINQLRQEVKDTKEALTAVMPRINQLAGISDMINPG